MSNADYKSNKVKSTGNYDHHDLEGVDISKIDESTIRTVSMPNGNKLVIGRNNDTNELQGIRLLVTKNES